MKKAIVFAAAAIFAAAMPAMARHKKQQEQQQPEVPPPVAQSGPSFEATRDWIADTLAQYGGYWEDSAGVWQVYSDVVINNSCVMTFTNTQFQSDYKSGSRPFSSVLVTVPLGAVTSSRLTEYRGAFSLDFDTGNISVITHTGMINYNSHINASDRSFASDSLDIARTLKSVAGQPEPDSPQDMAKRFLPAFQHMVDICKSTYHSPPPQPKEPF